MHDTKAASVELRRSELEMLIQLLAEKYSKVTEQDEIRRVSELYAKLSQAKGGL